VLVAVVEAALILALVAIERIRLIGATPESA
jgi:hypothetical protein